MIFYEEEIVYFIHLSRHVKKKTSMFICLVYLRTCFVSLFHFTQIKFHLITFGLQKLNKMTRITYIEIVLVFIISVFIV